MTVFLGHLALVFGLAISVQAQAGTVKKQKGCRIIIEGIDSQKGQVLTITDTRGVAHKAKVRKARPGKVEAALSRKSCRARLKGASVSTGAWSSGGSSGNFGGALTLAYESFSLDIPAPTADAEFDGDPGSFSGTGLSLMGTYFLKQGNLRFPLQAGLAITSLAGEISYEVPGVFSSAVPELTLMYLRLTGGAETTFVGINFSGLAFFDYTFSGSASTRVYTAVGTQEGTEETVETSVSSMRYGLIGQASYLFGIFELGGGFNFALGNITVPVDREASQDAAFTNLSYFLLFGVRI